MRGALLVLVCSTALTVACDDDDDDDAAEEHGGTADEHGDEPAVCSEISDACHDLDSGEGMAHDCHITAHEGEAMACEEVHDECIAFCGGADSGSSGSSGSSG